MSRVSDSVLLLDSAKEMGDLVDEFLTERGYRVQRQSEASKALESLAKVGFDFLLISERIQGLGVVDFVEKAVALNPDLFVILYSSKEEMSHHIKAFHRRYRRLPSPLVLESLLQILNANSNKVDAG